MSVSIAVVQLQLSRSVKCWQWWSVIEAVHSRYIARYQGTAWLCGLNGSRRYLAVYPLTSRCCCCCCGSNGFSSSGCCLVSLAVVVLWQWVSSSVGWRSQHFHPNTATTIINTIIPHQLATCNVAHHAPRPYGLIRRHRCCAVVLVTAYVNTRIVVDDTVTRTTTRQINDCEN